jgi:hypothetical protein
MGKVVGVYLPNRLLRELERFAGGMPMSSALRRIVEDFFLNPKFIIAVPERHKWIVGKFLVEEFPVLVKKYNEMVTGREEDVKVKVYGGGA